MPFLFPRGAGDFSGSHQRGFGGDLEWANGPNSDLVLVQECFGGEKVVRYVGYSL